MSPDGDFGSGGEPGKGGGNDDDGDSDGGDGGDEGLPIGAVAGGAAGGVVALLLFAWCCFKYKRAGFPSPCQKAYQRAPSSPSRYLRRKLPQRKQRADGQAEPCELQKQRSPGREYV